MFTAETQRTQRFTGICRSDFSRELLMFATKVAPTNNRKFSAYSAVNNLITVP